MKKLACLLTIAAASSLSALSTHAQTVIDHLPYVITAKGRYVLNADLNSAQTSGFLIDIEASNVTIDFQGHYISGPVGNADTSSTGVFGVYAQERSNVTLRNGTIAYCQVGVALGGNNQPNTNAVGLLVDDLRVTHCVYGGIVMADCLASRVQNCQVSLTGTTGANSAYGIYADGDGIVVQNNTISTVTATNSYGVYAATALVRQNTISDAGNGLFGAKYQDNLTFNCTTPYSGGIDAGGNN